MTFADFLHARIERRAISTEDALASVLPLIRQVLQLHQAGRVAPLRGVGHLNVDGVRLWVEAAKSLEPRSAAARLREIEKPASLSFDIVEEGRLTDDVTAGESRYQSLRMGRPGQPISAPVYLPGYVSWEHEIGHHDPLADVFSLGTILASLSLGLDLADPEDLEAFVAARGNLFALNPRLHPVLAQAIVRMTELDRHKRAQDLASILLNLETYRDQPVDVVTDLARAGEKAPADRRTILLERLRERLFEISRRNRLLYHQPTLHSLNLTIASVPLLFDVRSIRPEQILTWQPDFARSLLSGESIPLGRYLRFEDAPYVSCVLDQIIAEVKRDQAEFGFAQLRLALCFLRWHNLKEAKEERIETPLVLLPVQLTRKKGVRDVYLLQAPTTVAEINPVLRHCFRQLYGIRLPESIDLSERTLDSLHEELAGAIQGSEPGVALRKVDKPPITLIHEKARRRLDQYQRRLSLRGRGVRSFRDLSYSYDRDNFAPLGLKLFQTRVNPPNAHLGELLSARTKRRYLAVPEPPVEDREQNVAYVGQGGEANPYSWDFDLCSVTLGNFKYRKMSLVRDYDALIEGCQMAPAFDSIFSLAPRAPAATPTPAPPIEKRHPVVACDPTQAAAIAQASAGRSFIIQGPPGTGKSQTITNLVADCVASGKRVLFVCEKRAAIDVVYQRLKQRGLDELCSLIHDSQEDKKAFILDLKKTYETFLEEQAKEQIDWPKRREQILQEIRRELEPIEKFDAAMRAAPEHIGMPLRRLLQRRIELSDAAPAKAPLPDYSLWNGQREGIDRLVAALREVEKSGIFSRHPLSLLSGEVLKADRPQEHVEARLESVRKLFDEILRALPPGCEKIEDVERLVACAEATRFLAERDLLALLKSDDALRAQVQEQRARQQALEQAREADKNWKDKLPKAEVGPALALARSLTGIFAFLKPSWWRLRKILNARYDFKRHLVKPTWIGVLWSLQKEYEAEEAAEEGERRARETYRMEERLEAFAAKVEEARRIAAATPVALPDAASVRRAADLRPALTRLVSDLDSFLADWRSRTIDQIQDDIDRVEEAIDLLPDFLPCLAELDRLPEPLAEAFRHLPVDARQLEAGIADRSLEKTYVQDRSLARFAGPIKDRHLSRLEKLHREWQEANARRIRAAVRDRFLSHASLASRPNESLPPEQRVFKKQYGTGRKELEHEFEKTMRYRSIRDLADGETGLVIRDLKPVWLMSPLSVSDALPLDVHGFDVVVFDEASQIPLEEGVPSIFRAGQAIVVGDQMQLPPTSFFSSRSSEEDLLNDEDEQVDTDLSSNSFLAYAARTLPSTMLGWHYRSRSESLISFSNSRFYEGRLLTVPESVRPGEGLGEIRAASPEEGGVNAARLFERSISFHFMDRGLYEQRRNGIEAAYIAHLVRRLLADGKGLSIGIVAFSEAQQAEIEGALDQLAREDPEFRDRLDREFDREEDGQFLGLLVKNLENIQGDERDVMILSVCYGKGPDGRMLMNFGPINQSGGEKRLNVAFSRAKHHMAVVSSIRCGDITNEYNDGANCLRNYLRYAEAVSAGDLRGAERVLAEIQLRRDRAEFRAGADAVVEQLAGELRSRGYEADLGVGQSRLRCDLAVRRAGERKYLGAVLVDTMDGYGEADVLARDLLKPSLLRSFGWRVYPLLAKDWHDDRAGVVNRLERFLKGEEEKAADDGPALPPPPVVMPRAGAPADDAAAPKGVRRFEFVEGRSSKFWEILVEGSRTTVRFGRIGTEGQTLTKEFATPADAARDAERLVREKLAKGYRSPS